MRISYGNTKGVDTSYNTEPLTADTIRKLVRTVREGHCPAKWSCYNYGVYCPLFTGKGNDCYKGAVEFLKEFTPEELLGYLV